MCLLFSPLVLAANLVLLFRSEIVLNVECLADFIGRLALDHIGNRFTANIEKGLDIEIVGRLSSTSHQSMTNELRIRDLLE